MTYVIPFPNGLAREFAYTAPYRVRAETSIFGGAAQRVEVTPRASVRVSGLVHKNTDDVFWTFVDRLAGGVNLAGFTDRTTRLRLGWDAKPALNTSGQEFWIATGATSTYAGESAGATWRTIEVQAAGAASEGDTSIAVDGLLSSETIPAGTPLRIGVARYFTRSAVTASSGAATLPLAHPLKADVADNTDIKIPGDFGLFQLAEMSLGDADVSHVQSFEMAFSEVFSGAFDSLTWLTT